MTDTPRIESPLTGNPRRGTLALPAPRPAYEVEIVRTGDATAKARFHGNGHVALADLMFFDALPEIDGQPARDAVWHGEAELDGYRWLLRADPGMRRLVVLDAPAQPRRGGFCGVDEKGRVVPGAAGGGNDGGA